MSDAEHHSPLDAFLGFTPKRARRHFISLAILAIAAIAAVILLVRFFIGSEGPYYFAPVEAGNIVPLMSERGIIHGTREMTVRARFDGTIISVPGPANGPVRFGQPLAEFDTASAGQGLAIDRASVTAAEAALAAARVTVQETASRLARFENVWRRSGGRVPSLNELEAARADAARAKQQEAAAQATVAAARLQVQDEANRLKGALIRSPINGYVVSRHVDPGRRVRQGASLFTLAAGRDRMTITSPLTSVQMSELRAGAKATVRIDDMPGEVQPATLARVISEGGKQSAIFVLDQAGDKVMPGMRATIEVELPERRDVLLVPNAALGFSPDGSTGRERGRIYLLSDDGEPRRVYVTAGASDGKRTEIFAQGVKPGAQVITGWRNAPAGGGRPAN